jgi:hypothetical protein
MRSIAYLDIRSVAQDKGIINIYRIDPCSADPKFRLEGQLDCKNSNLPNARPIVDYVCLTHDYLFVYYIDFANDAGAFFVLWSWNIGTGIKWRVDLSRGLESDSVSLHLILGVAEGNADAG